LVHCAETVDQAYRDVEFGIEQWFDYLQSVAAFPQMSVPGSNVKEMISFINDSGFGAIGTPDMVDSQISRLWKQSNGGFGAYLMLAHNWANFDATRKSYDLIARNVFPRWQGQLATQGAADRARAARPELAAVHMKAVGGTLHTKKLRRSRTRSRLFPEMKIPRRLFCVCTTKRICRGENSSHRR
jgi:limonene 1,2-monooxygenase